MNDTPSKVLVIVARGLQLGALGCYGNGWIDTPALDRLAAEGIVFDQHFADAASPEGARAAWRSGCYDFPDVAANPLTEKPNLVQRLSAAGIPCCLVLDESRPLPGDFVQDWTTVHRPVPEVGETYLEATVAAAEACLKESAGRERWLFWVELATLLPPWNIPSDFLDPYFSDEPLEEDDDEPRDEDDEEEDEEPWTPHEDPEPGPIDPEDDTLYLSLRTTYAAAVTYLDAGIGELLETLRGPEAGGPNAGACRVGLRPVLGEHGLVGPIRPWLHEEIVHLPLLVRLPGLAGAGRRVAALTQAVDLAPTLRKSLACLYLGATGTVWHHCCMEMASRCASYVCAGPQVGEAIEWCMRTPDWALLLPLQLHPDDPGRGPQPVRQTG